MIFEWDEAKRAVNLAKHGVDFARIWDFEWHSALIFQTIGWIMAKAANGRSGLSMSGCIS
jgi:uncharacterized DUF497 family protein